MGLVGRSTLLYLSMWTFKTPLSKSLRFLFLRLKFFLLQISTVIIVLTMWTFCQH